MLIPRTLNPFNPLDNQLLQEVKTRLMIEGYPENELLEQALWIGLSMKLGVEHEPESGVICDILKYVGTCVIDGEPMFQWKFPEDFFKQSK